MDSIWQTDFVIAHTNCLARSFKKWTGYELLPGNFTATELAEKIFRAPFSLVAHGTEIDPILNYGNQTSLNLWEMLWDEFTRTPSRLTAEAPNRKERARLLKTVVRRGFIDNYSGVRISKTGRCFEISRAIVWNLISETGEYRGQAAMFSEWKYL